MRSINEIYALLDFAVAITMVEILPVVLPGLLLGVHSQGFEFLQFREGHLDLICRQGRTRALRPRVFRGPAPQATMDSDDG